MRSQATFRTKVQKLLNGNGGVGLNPFKTREFEKYVNANQVPF